MQKKLWRRFLIGIASLMGISLTLSSCATTPSSIEHNYNTTFANSLDVGSDQQLNKLLPSEANNDVNRPVLLAFILKNGIGGNKSSISTNNLKINVVTPNDADGSLNLTYTINDYYVHNVLVQESKSINISIRGFLKSSSVTDTFFQTSGNVNVDSNLKNLLPSEAKLINHQTNILTFIFNNLISGKKDNLLINYLSFLSANGNDQTGTLEVKYSITNYWENNVQQTITKEVFVSLTGFLQKTDSTIFSTTSQIDVSTDLDLSKLSTNELTISANKILIQKLLFNNQISGNKQEMDFNNVVISNFIKEDSSNGTITVNYEVNKYWSDKGIILNNNKSFSVDLSGFKKVNLSDEEILKEINFGGTTNGLTVNKFLPIIESLSLSNQSRLNSFSDESLNQIIKTNPNFSNINLEISLANQSTQNLSLKITGTYKNVNIPANETIDVTGFYNSIDQYHPFSKFIHTIFISKIDFNLNNYFNDLQTEADIKNWSSTDWVKKYLSNLTIAKSPQTSEYINFNLIDYYNNKIFDSVTFNNVEQSILAKSWSALNINVDYANYQYDNVSKTWSKVNDSNIKTLNFKTNTSLKFNVPSKQEAIDWIAKYGVSFDTSVSSTYFASYWYSLYQKDDITAFNGLIVIADKFKNKYFDDKLILNVDSVSIDDLSGSMYVSYKLVYNENEFISSPASTSTNSFKPLETFIQNNSAENKNMILVSNSTSSSKDNTLFKNIIKSIKKDFTVDELKAFEKDKFVDMKSKPILFRNNNQYQLFNGNKSLNDKLDEAYLDFISPELFGKTISRKTIDIDKNLFISGRTSDNTSKFMINLIYVNVDKDTKATLAKYDDTKFIYKVPFKYSLDVEGNSLQSVEIASYYFTFVLNSELGL